VQARVELAPRRARQVDRLDRELGLGAHQTRSRSQL
jgi:hypothetical protein